MDGYLPENDVDHINRIRNDNRWGNLRHVSRQCNNRNVGLRKCNKTGVTGVNSAYNGLWKSDICVNRHHIGLGLFSDFNYAVKARWDAEVKYDFPACNSTSPAYLYLKENNLLCMELNDTSKIHTKIKNLHGETSIPGVRFDKGWHKWRAKITVDYNDMNLGASESFEDCVILRYFAEFKYLGAVKATNSPAYTYMITTWLTDRIIN